MKSKTVASILRHVASKIDTTDIEPSSAVAAASPVEALERDSRRSRRNRQANDEDHDDIGAGHGGGGGANEEQRLEQLYETIAWPLGKTYGHPYDAFKLALTQVLHLAKAVY